MILSKQNMLYRILLYCIEAFLKLLHHLHAQADIASAFFGTTFFLNVLMEPVNYYEKFVNMGFGLTTALIVALVKVIWPNGLTQIVNWIRRKIMKIYFIRHILPSKKNKHNKKG